MRDKIAAFLRTYVSPGARLCAAVSGGMDSMALLDALRALSASLDCTLCAVHFNHQLRGDASLQDEAFVRRFCAERNIPLKTGSGDVKAYADANKIGIEEAARTMRYAYFESLPDVDWILTAHTADDNLETVLMHLIRGTGLHGLTGIPPVRGRILRPMLHVTRAEIQRYCKDQHLPHRDDASNDDDTFLRNRIRHLIVPLLKEENPSVVPDTAEMCRSLLAEDQYLHTQAERLLPELVRGGQMDCIRLGALSEAMRFRVMALFLSDVPQIGRAHLAAALELSQNKNPSAVLDLPGRFRLRRVYDRLELTGLKDTAPLPAPVMICPGQTVSFGPWSVHCSDLTDQGFPAHNALALDASVLDRPLTIRARLPGDRICLSGGTKKVSRLLIDEKVPAHLRDSVPILCAGEEIAAVLPLKAAAAFRSGKGKISIMLSVTKMEDEK